jgi:predicted MFS family arabinose efflux permease
MEIESQTAVSLLTKKFEKEIPESQDRHKVSNIILILINSLVALTCGLGLNSVAVEYQKSKNLSENNPNFELYFSIAVAMFLAGGGIGHIIYELVDSKKFSKKNFLVLGSILNLTSFSIIYFYTYYYIIGVARFFMGLNAGFASAIVPGTIYKLAPQKRKGIFGAFYPGFVGLGLLIGQVMTIFKDASMLFIPHITLCVLFFIQTVSLYFIPNMDVEESNEKEKNVFQTLRSKEARRSVILAVIFHLAQHLSGFNYLTLFTDQILADSPNPYFFGIMNFVIALVFTCLSGFLCDLGGRKLMFVLSCVTSAISIICFKLLNVPHIMLGFFFLSYNFGLGCIPWTVLDEMFTAPFVKSGKFIAVCVNWSASFSVTIISKYIFQSLGNSVYTIFSISILLAASIVAIFFRETKNQIQPRLQ